MSGIKTTLEIAVSPQLVIDAHGSNCDLCEKYNFMKQKVINQTANGCVFICPGCDKIHVEFQNFLFSFDEKEYKHFSSCFLRLDGAYYEQVNARLHSRRKIIVPIGHRNASMQLNRKELEEIQVLLSGESAHLGASFFLSTREIGIPMGIN